MFNSILNGFGVPNNYKALFDIETQNWTVYWILLESTLSIRVQFNPITTSNSTNNIYELQVFSKENIITIEVSFFEIQQIESMLNERI